MTSDRKYMYALRGNNFIGLTYWADYPPSTGFKTKLEAERFIESNYKHLDKVLELNNLLPESKGDFRAVPFMMTLTQQDK